MKRLLSVICATVWATLLSAQHIVTPLHPDDVINETQWKGQWIGIDRLLPGEEMENKTRVNARYLRKEFTLEQKTVRKARAFVASQGYYELYVNGNRIGEDVLTPLQTDFRKSIYYNVLDVTEALKADTAACIGIILGNGRTVPMRYLKHYKCPFFGLPKCRVDVFVEYIDGSKQRLYSSNQWKATASGPIRSNNEYDGEVYDARLDMPSWAKVGFDDSSWQWAERAELPMGTLYPQAAEGQTQTELGEEYTPRRVKDNVFDCRQNIAGWVKVKVRGGKGDTIRIKYAERLNPDGTLYTANLRDAETEDVYVCSGNEGEGRWWHPTFVYHGFRYVRITGIDGITEADIKPCLVANNVERTGSFTSSNATLNAIVRNAWWGIIDNYKGFPVDCPQRNERQPWLGDRTAGSLGESYLFDNNRLYTGWMRDICDAQRYDGALPDVAPAFWNYYTDNVTWPAALPFTCEMLYQQYGNDEAIRNSYPYIKKWIDHICGTYSKEGIITKDKYGDWCMPPEKPELIHSQDPSRKTDGALLSTAYMIRILNMMHDFAALQGLHSEAAQYGERAVAMAEAFNRKFLHVKRGTSPQPGHPLYPDSVFYGNNTATANILPLAFDIVPDDCRQDVVDNVVKNIVTDNGGHVSCGVIGISHLLRTLTANGYGDVAYLIATNTSYPSWGYMAKHGATTIWELWNGDTANPAMNSGNHVMLLGDLLAWCFQDLAGIKNAEGSVGYKHLMMRPDFSIQDLDSVSASYKTPRGTVISRWQKSLETLTWTVTLPKGTTADCQLPDGSVRKIKEGTTTIKAKMPLEQCYHGFVTDDEFVYDSCAVGGRMKVEGCRLEVEGCRLGGERLKVKGERLKVVKGDRLKDKGCRSEDIRKARRQSRAEGGKSGGSGDCGRVSVTACGTDKRLCPMASYWETPSLYPETHSSTIAELTDGTLLTAYFGGTKERVPDVCIYTQRKEKGADSWDEPVFAADGVFETGSEYARIAGIDSTCVKAHFGPCRRHGIDWHEAKHGIRMSWHEALADDNDRIGAEQRKACWNPVLFQMPNGEVWLFFKIGKNVKDWTGWLCKSTDGGRTWGEKEPLPEGFLGPIKNKPELVGGRLLCPSSTENNGWKLHFETYDIATGQWTKQLPQNSDSVLCIQPSLLRHGGDTLQAVARTRPTKAQREMRDTTRGRIATCWSYDGGRTWGKTAFLDVLNNQSGIDAVTLARPVDVKAGGTTLKGMRHVLIYNDFGTLPGTGKGPRTPLSLAVSADGIRWHHLLTLEDSPISQYSYPAIIQGRDGYLHAVYTWRRQRIAYKRIVLGAK